MMTEAAAALAIAAIWPPCIWGVVEIAKRYTPRRWWPLLPLAIGLVSGPAVVAAMVEAVDFVDHFPAVHALMVGLGAGGFASSIHATKKAATRDDAQ